MRQMWERFSHQMQRKHRRRKYSLTIITTCYRKGVAVLLDINAYVGHWPFKQLKHNTCSLLLERMNKFGVDVSIISNLNAVFYKNTQSGNEELYDEINSDPRFRERFIAF